MADIPGQIEHLVQEDRLTQPVWYEWLLGFYRSFSAFKSNAEGAWTSFTPTVTAGASGPPTVTINYAHYRRIGHTVSVAYDITATALNGSTGVLSLTLPITPAASVATFFGREIALSGLVLGGTAGGSVVQMVLYNNTTIFGAGAGLRVLVNGTYEV